MKLNAATDVAAELPGAHYRARLVGPNACLNGVAVTTEHGCTMHECNGLPAHIGEHACRCGLSWQ